MNVSTATSQSDIVTFQATGYDEYFLPRFPIVNKRTKSAYFRISISLNHILYYTEYLQLIARVATLLL